MLLLYIMLTVTLELFAYLLSVLKLLHAAIVEDNGRRMRLVQGNTADI